MSELRPHPRTGQPFPSPVPPGTGWPGDPARPRTRQARNAEDVTQFAERSRTLADLDARSSVCRACPRLVDWREEVAARRRRSFDAEPYWGRPVPSFGDRNAQLLVVGLAPAAHGANRTGRMFTGDRSGDWLFAAMHRAGYANRAQSLDAADGLELTGARIVAPVRCAPPDNRPSTVERHTCAPWMDREIELLSGTMTAILALGGVAWQATFAALARLGWQVPRPRPKFGHGARGQVVPRGRAREVTVLGCYHVSQQNTFTGRLTESMLDDVFTAAREAGSRPGR